MNKQPKQPNVIEILSPLERLWNNPNSVFKLKFQLCKPADPFAFLCNSLSLNIDDIQPDMQAAMKLWLLSKSSDWK